MNVIYISHEWMVKLTNALKQGGELISVQQIQSLLSDYALKDFRLINPKGTSVDLWLDDLDLGDYGMCKAVYVKDPEDTEYEWQAVPCPDGSVITKKLISSGMVCFMKKNGNDRIGFANQKDEGLLTVSAFWFLINQDILKKYKTLVKMGKRRHQIQEMGEKRASSYNQKPIKIADGISYVWEYENPRSFNRHCEAWGVRGHYRHYKSGKVVFIHPYIKGSGRLKDSLYEL